MNEIKQKMLDEQQKDLQSKEENLNRMSVSMSQMNRVSVPVGGSGRTSSLLTSQRSDGLFESNQGNDFLAQNQHYFMSNVASEDTVPVSMSLRKTAHENGCTVMDFNPNGLLATGGNDGYVKVWDTKTGFDSKNCKLLNCMSISCLRCTQQGNLVACAGSDL